MCPAGHPHCFGFLTGGFGGLLVAFLLMTVLYTGLSFSLAELSAAMPHTGGAYSFARASMGPGAAAWFGLGLTWFAFYARTRLILSPEERFAVMLSRARSL